MIIDSGVATLVAAILAAILSGINLLNQKKTEIRSANRQYLGTFIEDLSQSIHQLIALSVIMLKNKTKESLQNTAAKTEEPKNCLKKLRTKIRYPLWGIDDSIQKLTRIPDFTLYTLANPEIAQENVDMAIILVKSVDRCIRNCYLQGRSPNLFEIYYIKYRVWRFTRIRDNFKKQKN